ncbi:MAG TPA: hypothetical protein VFU31_01255 [Candidatus Binatia bacterium]|nr:hypothetical protein [Candidatus Binatia bacterium]
MVGTTRFGVAAVVLIINLLSGRAETKMRPYTFSLSFRSENSAVYPTFWSKLSTLLPSVILLSSDRLNKVSGIQLFSSRRRVAQELPYKVV